MAHTAAHIILPASAALLLAATTACNTDECYENRNSLPLAGFYRAPRAGEVPEAVSLSGVSIWGEGVPGDSLLTDHAGALQEVYLPFKIDTQQTSFVIRYDSTASSGDEEEGEEPTPALTDTISFAYRAEPLFVTAACGVFYRFNDVKPSWTSNMIDSVTCPTGYIDNTDTQNLHIYLRTEPQQPEEE